MKLVFLSIDQENFLYFSSVLILNSFTKREIIASIEASPCAITVAHAAPATPILKVMTNSKSRPTFKIDEKIKNKSGVLESPSAVKIPVAMLYKNTKAIPAM